MAKLNLKYIILFVFTFLIELIIALFIRDNFIRPYLGDVIVVILIYFFIRIFFDAKLLPAYIFLFAVLIELCQKINVLQILKLNNNKFLSIVLGSHFDYKDIVCYFAGMVILFIFRKYNVF